MKTKSVTLKYSLFQGAYWASAVLSFGYTRLFLKNYGYNATVAGIVLATCSLAAALLQPFLATVMHKKSISLRAVLFAITAFGILCALLLFLPLPAPVVAVFFTLLGITVNSAMGFVNASGFALKGAGETVNFSAARAVGSVCYAIVAKFMSLASSNGALVACYLAGAIPLAVFAYTMLPRHDAAPERKAAAAPVAGGFFKRNRSFLLMMLAQGFIFFMHHIITGYLLDITLFCGGTEDKLGTAILVGALCELPGMLVAGRYMKKHSPVLLLQISAIMYFVRTALFVLFPSMAMVYVLEVMQAVTFALLIPAFPVFVEEYILPEDKLRCQTINTGVNAASGFLSFLLGGVLADALGILVTLKIALLVSLPGTLLLFFCAARAEKERRSAAQ